ncbi:MAG: protein TolR [Gammaproteobacteria bacterium]|jgi:biopolymer transport protein TolR|nr:protein TolR [Gammaproteobacteria bacterium]
MLRRARKRPMSEINIVPYIDVMLVLLVVFMVAAPLLTLGVSVELPKAAAKPMQSERQEPLVASVDAEGNMYLNIGDNPDAPLDADTLVQRVAAVLRHQPETPVMVRGDTSADYGSVVRVMALLQTAGAPSVGLVTESPEQAAPRGSR